MKSLKKFFALCLTLALVLSLAACGKKEEGPSAPDDPAVETTDVPNASTAHFKIAALKGPTAMGLVRLMRDNDEMTSALLNSSKPYEGEVGNFYTFTLAGSADEVTPALIKGEIDMACVPANLAAVLYNKTEGAVQVLAVNTLGVLYIVENGESVQSLADLKGKTVVAAGKGSTPEYALRYLLSENGIDPDADVTLDWKSEHSECVAALASGQASIALLPQPFVTVAQSKLEGLRMALDLTAEWDKLDNGSALITGVIVARSDFVEAHPAAVGSFLELSRKHSNDLVCGYARTSSAYPARARLARRMADAGACLAALSLAPKDVMCRLRVYPLAAVSQLSACIGLGRRAEFEFESLVRLMWMGLRLLELPVDPRPPADGVSHYQPVRDTLRIAGMSAKLFIIMLTRLPAVLISRSTGWSPAPGLGSEHPQAHPSRSPSDDRSRT